MSATRPTWSSLSGISESSISGTKHEIPCCHRRNVRCCAYGRIRYGHVVRPRVGFTESSTQGCAEEWYHPTPGRYVITADTPNNHLHVASRSGISGISVSRTPNRIYYPDGSSFDIPEGHNGFRIEYTANRVNAVIAICFQYVQAPYLYGLAVSGPIKIGSSSSIPAPPSSSQQPPTDSQQTNEPST